VWRYSPKGPSVQVEDTGTDVKVLLAEVESGIAREPAVVEPAPAHRDLVAVLEEIRDKQVFVVVLRDRLPSKHRLVRVKLTEHGDTFPLNGEEVYEAEAVGEEILPLQVIVNRQTACDPYPLGIVETLPNIHS